MRDLKEALCIVGLLLFVVVMFYLFAGLAEAISISQFMRGGA